MPSVRGSQPPVQPVRPDRPVISAAVGHILVTGSGFLPDCPVTVRIASTGDDVVDYLTYTSDADGYLHAALPQTAITGHIAVTDHRPDPFGDGGLLWSNTVTVTYTGR